MVFWASVLHAKRQWASGEVASGPTAASCLPPPSEPPAPWGRGSFCRPRWLRLGDTSGECRAGRRAVPESSAQLRRLHRVPGRARIKVAPHNA